MVNAIKTEFIKERRSANSKMLIIVPIVFVLFNVLMLGLMGESPEGKSYLMATSFNWYAILLLPIVLSLLLINVQSKERKEHMGFQRRLNVRAEKLLLAKNVTVIFELFSILLVSAILLFFVGYYILHENILVGQLMLGFLCLFLGSLPIIALSFLVYRLINKRFVVIILNFVLMFPSAVIAVTKNWMFFPWAYNLRILSSVVGVHPNGTFLAPDSPLMNRMATYYGLILSVAVYISVLLLTLFLERSKSRV